MIIYIDIDSLRPDHVGAYGYEKPTTPNLDGFATEAVRFDRAYVANSPCMPSRAALMSGRYGVHNGISTHGPASQTLRTPVYDVAWAGSWSDHVEGEPWRTLPELFYENRAPTFAVSSFPRHPAPWFHTTWHQVRQPQEPEGSRESFQTVRAETVVDSALDLIDRHDGDEAFLYLQLWDPHGPYLRTDDQVEPFRDGPLPPYPTADQIADHQAWDAWRSAGHMDVEDRSDLDELIANYDAEIRYADRHLGRFFSALRDAGMYDDALIVVTADHGEEFGEHGLYREHWSTHDGTQRVPLLIKPPDDYPSEPGGRDQLVTNVDLPPTLAAYAGYAVPEHWQGRSVRPIIENPEVGWRDYVVVDHGLYTAQRAVRTDRWKYVRTYHPGMWEGVVPDRQLFDMRVDEWEQDDISDGHPDVMTELEHALATWVERNRSDHPDPLREAARAGPAGFRAFEDDWEGV